MAGHDPAMFSSDVLILVNAGQASDPLRENEADRVCGVHDKPQECVLCHDKPDCWR